LDSYENEKPFVPAYTDAFAPASSCSGSKAAVRTDVPVTELATAIEEHLAADTLALMNEGYI
jgi:hypothetical protein